MVDQKPDNINDNNFNIIVSLHPTVGTHWVLVIRRDGGKTHYFDSFGAESPPFSLEQYVDLYSDERIQEYNDTYCGAYCLCMIYLIHRGFRIKSATIILNNQVKNLRMYNECWRFSRYYNKNNVNEKARAKDKDGEEWSNTHKDNDENKDKIINLFGEKHLKLKPKENARSA